MSDYNHLIGLTVEEAKEKGVWIRVMREDNQRYVGTMDFRPTRINVEVENGKIIKVNGVG